MMGARLAWGLMASIACVGAIGGAFAQSPAQSQAQSPAQSQAQSPAQSNSPLQTQSSSASSRSLPAAVDLAADGNVAREKKVPVLLFFNRVGCPYCERALREYLKPMERNPETSGR